MGKSVAAAGSLVTEFTYIKDEVLLSLVHMYNVLQAMQFVPDEEACVEN